MSDIISHMSSIPEDRWEKAFGKGSVTLARFTENGLKPEHPSMENFCNKLNNGEIKFEVTPIILGVNNSEDLQVKTK